VELLNEVKLTNDAFVGNEDVRNVVVDMGDFTSVVAAKVAFVSLIGNGFEGTCSVVVVNSEELNFVIAVWLTLAVVEDLESISLAAGSEVGVSWATVDVLASGTLAVDEEIGEVEDWVLVTEGLEPRVDDEATTLVAEVDFKSAAGEKMTAPAVVALIRDTVVSATDKLDVGADCVDTLCSKPDVVCNSILTSVEGSAVGLCVTLTVDGDSGVWEVDDIWMLVVLGSDFTLELAAVVLVESGVVERLVI